MFLHLLVKHIDRLSKLNVYAELFINKQEGHDGPVSLHWLTLGNLFKT